MKTLLLAMLLLSNSLFAMPIRVQGTVPLVVNLEIKKLNETRYEITETSNCRNGYKVIVYTDATVVTYNDIKRRVTDGQVTITSVEKQDQGVIVKKILKIKSKTPFSVSLQPNCELIN